ncbi:MAG: electron transport complex subunit RsxC [Gemmatimonadales bacterium]
MFGSSFSHGVHPPDLKGLTQSVPVRRLPFPDEVILPLRQHAGKPAVPLVRKGDRVERGDKIAEADGFISAPVHSSAAGMVSDIGLWPHPDGSYATAVWITVEPHSAQALRPRMVPRWDSLDRQGIVDAVKEAGVVGLGGAAFPTHVKLVPPPDARPELLIVNGCECEPYLTTDHRSMVEYPERVQLGIRIMMKCLGVERTMIGVERNKPDAIAALERTLPDDIDVTVHPLTVKYPQGAEKMLIAALTAREIPSGRLPIHAGIVVQNVASIATIAEVFETGMPLIERIVTVTGTGVARPSNLIVPVGTKLSHLLEHCGGLTDDAAEVIFGGPMMGAPQSDLAVPILKGTTGVVVLSELETKREPVYPCIKCGHCLTACPVFLNPQLLGSLARAERYDEMLDAHLMDCMLCGCCSYTCPSNIPLSQLFQQAKAAVQKLEAA